ncbi:hypothetical protein [Flavobacterium sp. BFFFF1]|uniref:hypothetical protein n=1 Tax=Flavobacterium sp. BFFFF1 TaxID=2015557 RepID=UPI0025C20A75|nr:hypothetical protein [Flavobacterium sp. BFFFF1]
MKRILVLFVLLSIPFISCTADDDSVSSGVVTLKINGQRRTFEALDYEKTLLPNGDYSLTFWMFASDGISEDSARLVTTYKRTGTNTVEGFYTSLHPNGGSANAVNGDFSSTVSVNSSVQFTADFSGTLGSGNNTILLTDGRINYKYDAPIGD